MKWLYKGEWLCCLHAIEGAPYKDKRYNEEYNSKQRGYVTESFADAYLHSQYAKEGGKLDDGVQSYGRGVLEGVAYRITN